MLNVAVAQLAERLLPIPEVRGSKQVVGKICNEHKPFTSSCRKDTNKQKSRREWPIFLKNILNESWQ